MAVESATYIAGLDENKPEGGDQKFEGDNHIRKIKEVLLNTLPNLDGVVNATDTELNLLVGKTAIGDVASEDTLPLTKGGTGGTTAVAARANLGLTIGTAVGEIVQLINNGGLASLPAVDGSALTGVSTTDALISGNTGSEVKKGASSLGTFSYVVKSTAYTAANGDWLAVDTSGGAVTITLPASPVDGVDIVRFVDYAGTFLTNNLTVARNGNNIMGQAEDMSSRENYDAFGLMYIDATQGWVLI